MWKLGLAATPQNTSCNIFAQERYHILCYLFIHVVDCSVYFSQLKHVDCLKKLIQLGAKIQARDFAGESLSNDLRLAIRIGNFRQKIILLKTE